MEDLVGMAGSVVVIVFMIAVAGFFYLIPTMVAFVRGHPHRHALLLLNVILGWSVVVWIAVLIWAIAIPVEGDGAAATGRSRQGGSPADRPPTRERRASDPFTDRGHPLA